MTNPTQSTQSPTPTPLSPNTIQQQFETVLPNQLNQMNDIMRVQQQMMQQFLSGGNMQLPNFGNNVTMSGPFGFVQQQQFPFPNQQQTQQSQPQQQQQQQYRNPNPHPPKPSEAEYLRDEQDYLYQESLRKDAEKEAIKEKEKQQKEEEELFAKLKDALEEHHQQEKESEKAKQREQLVPTEPGEKEANITQLQIRMPDGSRVLRRFRQDETLQVVMNFVVTVPNVDLTEQNIILSAPPNQTFSDLTKTLKQLNLFPRAVLVVQKK